MRLHAALMGIVLMSLFASPGVSTGAWFDGFLRDDVGPEWTVRSGTVTVSADEGMRLSASDSYAMAEFVPSPVGDGLTQILWNPVELAPNWKQFYVFLRGADGNDEHRVWFRVDEGDVCFTRSGTPGTCWNFAWTATWHLLEIYHVDGVVKITINGNEVGAETYPATETATTIVLGASDNGSGHLVRSFSHVSLL